MRRRSARPEPTTSFAPTTIFEWEHEPADERPSEFSSTTSYSTVSGYFPSPVRPRERARPQSRFGLMAVVFFVGVMVGLAAWALPMAVRLLRG